MKCKFIRKSSVEQKIFFSTTLILISSILITGAFVQKQSRSLYAESLDKAIQLIVQKYSTEIEECFKSAEDLRDTLKLECLSFVPRMEKEQDVTQNYRIYLELKEKVELLCEVTLGQNSAYNCYLFLNSELPISSLFGSPGIDQLYSNSLKNDLLFAIYSDERLKEEEWFQTAMVNKDYTYWFASPENNHIMLSISNLSDTFLINGQAIHCAMGTLVVSIDVSRSAEEYKDNSITNDMEMIITDADYRILYAEDSSLVDHNFINLIEEKDALSVHADTYQIITINGQEYCLWKKAFLNDMHLFTLLPEQNFSKHIQLNIQIVLLLFLIVLLAEVILSALFLGMITRPIRRLSAHINNSSIPTPIPYVWKTEDEISTLYRAYNEMVQKQELLIQEIYDSSMNRKKLEYQLLQAQINPHFLYNTLDSVSCAAILNGEKELSRILSVLAKLFRYNVNQPEQLVTLYDELEMVNYYIEIQQFRYENRVCFTCHIPEEMEFIKVPKMIIQPLVENGIFYGRANEDGLHHISIHAKFDANMEGICKKKEELVSIWICNDHQKRENSLEDDIKKLNNYLDGNCEIERRNSGLGILNVQQRIRLSFGENYGIHYRQMGNQIAAVIELPVYI